MTNDPYRPPHAPTARPFELRRPLGVTLLAILQWIQFGSLLLVILAAVLFAIRGELDALGAVIALFVAILAAGAATCAVGLWGLKPVGRRLQIFFAVRGLLGVPIGTLVSILILYYMSRPSVKLLFSDRDPATFTPEEQALAQQDGGGAVVVVAAIGIAFATICGVGVIASIEIPNLLNAIDRGRQKRTMADLRSIGTAIEFYGATNDRYPDAQSLVELTPQIYPEFIQGVPATDGWGHPIQVRSNAESYVVISPGKDGLLDTPNPELYPRGEQEMPDADTVFQDGAFVQWWKGVNSGR